MKKKKITTLCLQFLIYTAHLKSTETESLKEIGCEKICQAMINQSMFMSGKGDFTSTRNKEKTS